jgi:hypothetical protein
MQIYEYNIIKFPGEQLQEASRKLIAQTIVERPFTFEPCPWGCCGGLPAVWCWFNIAREALLKPHNYQTPHPPLDNTYTCTLSVIATLYFLQAITRMDPPAHIARRGGEGAGKNAGEGGAGTGGAEGEGSEAGEREER